MTTTTSESSDPVVGTLHAELTAPSPAHRAGLHTAREVRHASLRSFLIKSASFSVSKRCPQVLLGRKKLERVGNQYPAQAPRSTFPSGAQRGNQGTSCRDDSGQSAPTREQPARPLEKRGCSPATLAGESHGIPVQAGHKQVCLDGLRRTRRIWRRE